MAKIVILTHEYDEFARRDFLLRRLSRHWRGMGHDVSVSAGPNDLPKADLAILHVDHSVVPNDYLEALRQYPRVVNGRVVDIRKRRISRNLLSTRHRWSGAVVVKTDLNCGGVPEWAAFLRSGHVGPDPLPAHPRGSEDYTILPSMQAVDSKVWKDPTKVVERFLPEQDERGYWLRTWVFFGSEERCTRYLSRDPIVKGSTVEDRAPVTVPRSLRAERERLGFDFGKFDFVLHEGRAVLFDANRTPAGSPLGPGLEESNRQLASGIASFL